MAMLLLGGCAPKLDSPNPDDRAKAVATTDDQAVLARIAAGDSDRQVRYLAIQRLTDQRALAKVASNGGREDLRLVALAKLSDLSVVARIAEDKAEPEGIRRAAVERLTDPVPLLRIALAADRDSRVLAESASARLTAPSDLEQVAVGSEVLEASRTAVARLTDPAALARVARTARSAAVRAAAVARVHDSVTLKQAAMRDWTAEVRRAALANLDDQAAFAWVAVVDTDEETRKLALGKLAKPAALLQVALEGEDDEVAAGAVVKLAGAAEAALVANEANNSAARAAATERSSQADRLGAVVALAQRVSAVEACASPEELVRAALDPVAKVRLAAVQNPRLDDQTLFERLALDDTAVEVGRAAVGRLGTQSALAAVALGQHNSGLREEAVAKLDDQAVLAEVANHDSETSIALNAVERLSDPERLAEVALAARDEVAVIAVEKVTNRAVLVKVATREYVPVARLAAIARLRDGDAALGDLLGKLDEPTIDAREALARLKIALSEPVVRKHWPELHCDAKAGSTSASYTGGAKPGESLTVSYRLGERTLAEATWYTSFPQATSGLGFLEAEVTGGDVLTSLFGTEKFTAAELAELRGSNLPEVRLAALAHSDEALLEQALMGDPHDWMRLTAARHVADQRVLARAAREDVTIPVRQAATGRVGDPAVLAEIARHDADANVRRVAVERITDPQVLVEIAGKEDDFAVGLAATDQLKDPELLLQVALMNRTEQLHRWLIDRVEGGRNLARAAAVEPERNALASLIARLGLKTVLKPELYPGEQDESEAGMKGVVVDAIQDPAKLVRLARGEERPWIRFVATVRVADQQVLAEVAQHDADDGVRAAAVCRLTDAAVLAQLAAEDRAEAVRVVATARREALTRSIKP